MEDDAHFDFSVLVFCAISKNHHYRNVKPHDQQ